MVLICKILNKANTDKLSWEKSGKQEREKYDLHCHLLGKWTSVMLNERWSLEIPNESQQPALLLRAKTDFKPNLAF